MRRLARLSIEGMKANLVPGILLQLLAAIVLGAYYLVPEAAIYYDRIGEWKERYGLWFSMISTGFFGGLAPFAYLYFTGKVKRGYAFRIGLFYVLFWVWKGFEVDLLYRWQAVMFGEGVDFATVASKVAFDQFVYCPFWSGPWIGVAYLWKDCLFDRQIFKSRLNRELFSLQIPSVVISLWIVWTPATAFIYSLPTPLQIPLFNLVLCFFVLLVSALGENDKKDEVD